MNHLCVSSYFSVWETEQELPVEAPGPPQGGVDGVQPVGGSDHHHLSTAVQPIHQGQQGGHDGAAVNHTAQGHASARTLQLRQHRVFCTYGPGFPISLIIFFLYPDYRKRYLFISIIFSPGS